MKRMKAMGISLLCFVSLIGITSCEKELELVEENVIEFNARKSDDDSNCGECKKGITSLDLEYLGNEVNATIKIYKDKVEKKKLLATFENVNTGDILSFAGVGKDKKMGAKIRITVNNSKKFTEIHTSCSKDIYVGMTFDDYLIVAGTSKEGGALCEVPECGECKKGVTYLELEYQGSEVNATIKIYKDKVEKKKLLATFENVNQGDVLAFSGVGKDDKMGKKIRITVNNKKSYTEIHTSCSRDIYVGMTFGEYLVIAGESHEGGALCEMPLPPEEGDCGECKKGITYLELQYLGESGVEVTVYGKHNDVIASWQNVSNGQVLAFSGPENNGKMGGSTITVSNGIEETEIHVSCSQDIYAGMTFGNYLIVAGSSLEGGALCEMPPPPEEGDCGECKKGITYLELQYLGDSGAEVTVYDKHDNVIASWQNVNNGQILAFSGPESNGKMGGSTITVSNGIEETEIHVSCSQDIYAGMVFGNYLIVAGSSLEGGALCSVEYCVTTMTDLIAGQNMVVGTVEVTDDGGNYLIKYSVIDGWCISETHLAVAWNLDDIPANNGNPTPGQFEYSDEHDCVSEYTYEVPKSEGIYIAAHAVVNCVLTSFDDFADSLPDVVSICTLEKGVDALDSYFNVIINNTSLAGLYDAWCVDQDNTLEADTCFEASVFSSYETLPENEFEHPENFDKVNWILNQNLIGQDSGDGDGIYTFGDIQLAIWDLIDDSTCVLCEYIGDSNPNRVTKIVNSAINNCNGFIPQCDELIAIVLIPNDSPRLLQSIIVAIPLPCDGEECEESAWAEGCEFPGNNWAMYFQLPGNTNP